MAANLPVPGSLAAIEASAAKALKSGEGVIEAMRAVRKAREANSGQSAAERADKHIQLWREGMAKMTLEVAFKDDPALDEAFRQIQRTEAWKILQKACLESPKIMAELRAYWKPEDKVEIRD